MDQVREQQIINEFGKSLKKIRTEKNLSTRALGDLAELDYSNINQIENGKVNPSVTTVVMLADALGIHPGEFFSKK